MNAIGKPERVTQERVKALLQSLGWTFLGDWTDRTNQPVEAGLLRAWLARQGRSEAQISRALDLLGREVGNPTRSLYDTNQAIYGLLRYGVGVKTGVDVPTETVWLIDWQNPANNDFTFAEEVTLKGAHERRPDLVLYLNGIAIGVIELKRSAVAIGEGVRQLISNQRPEFNAGFFATVHLLLAGNDSEGLRYGTVGTPEPFYLSWKEDEADSSGYRLDRHLRKLCAKDRLIELLHDFVLYDGGVKKLPRPHQYFGVKAAQTRVQARQGGIIWHTQGSGKSIVMVLLARWILERRPQARVVIVTDRDELDKQIDGVFTSSGETIARSTSGADLMAQLGQATPRLICSLVHKFGKKGVADFDAFIRELKANPSPAVGELFVFVDECHRTQSGRLHQTMKALLPGAVFIGFTGTPLLKEDRQQSREIFGDWIHTYKFGEAVDDQVVLDLAYEARDIPQELSAQDKVDQWFEAKTKGLNDWQKAALREQWGTMQRVLSSRSRMERVVADIVFDFGTKPRLISQRGTAMLVASSIYEACRYYDLFQKTGLAGHCAVVTSYNPQASDITTEDTGANTDTEKEFIYHLYTDLLAGVQPKPGKTRTEVYEDEAKSRFIKQPAVMRLLIVVDKLLTGFDAPSCTYLYIDKSMQDHGLFQAICRTNRLDGDDKPVGNIVDYKDLFKKVKGAIEVYTKDLDESAGGSSPEVLMQNRLEDGRKRLDGAREALKLLCEPVPPPKDELAHIRHFCGNPEIPADLSEHEPERVALYQTVASLLRAYAAIAGELAGAGYTQAQVAAIEQEKEGAVELRNLIRQASGETLDLKPYEADMRHLIDTYISAAEARTISDFAGLGLVDILVKSGLGAALASLPAATRKDERAVAETIANNVRSTIIKKHLLDPAYYDRMSTLLQEVLADLKAKRIEYQAFLERVAALAKQVQDGQTDATPEVLKKNPGLRAIYNALLASRAAEERAGYDGEDDPVLLLAQRLDARLRQGAPNGWRGVKAKELIVQGLIFAVVQDHVQVERLFPIIVAQGY
ncbi:MAG: HsdR family type I site-specific deoxyribonuclease [Planctomycetes bacterium]|nr:HsdR family type I site-specific deoxyribonuclease [Planctomycetota bacterium]